MAHKFSLARIARVLCGSALVLFVAGCMGDTRPKVVIEWGIEPDELAGLDVEIDGKVVGKLEKFGEATRTAFIVDKGDHQVCVRHPRYPCKPAKVAAELAAQRIMLIVDFTENFDPSGAAQMTIELRQ